MTFKIKLPGYVYINTHVACITYFYWTVILHTTRKDLDIILRTMAATVSF